MAEVLAVQRAAREQHKPKRCKELVMSKVFLGGTCNGSTWRDELIPYLDVDYFNPVVDDWTPERQAEEERQKAVDCDVHLYVITEEMVGVFSIAETIESAMTDGKECIMHIVPDGFSKAQIKSFEAVCNMVKKHGGYAWIEPNIRDAANAINIHYS